MRLQRIGVKEKKKAAGYLYLVYGASGALFIVLLFEWIRTGVILLAGSQERKRL